MSTIKYYVDASYCPQTNIAAIGYYKVVNENQSLLVTDVIRTTERTNAEREAWKRYSFLFEKGSKVYTDCDKIHQLYNKTEHFKLIKTNGRGKFNPNSKIIDKAVRKTLREARKLLA